jgi:putative Mg2+ transporter-C (MgtC) family protein
MPANRLVKRPRARTCDEVGYCGMGVNLPIMLLADAAPLMSPRTIALRLGLACALAMLIGLEREKPHRAAGLRTHMLVGLGAALFVIAALAQGVNPDASSRVIQGVIQGIGFLGAGTIFVLSDRMEVRGLTTAASIWVTAGIGIACGLGEFWVACIGTALAWFALRPMKVIEERVVHRRPEPEDPAKQA